MLSSHRRIAAAMLVLGLAGCTQAAESERDPGAPRQSRRHLTAEQLRAGSAAQDRVLAAGRPGRPGRPGRQDVAKAVLRVKQCLTAFHVELRNEGWDPVGQQHVLLTYRNLNMPSDELNEINEECRAAHLDKIESRFAKNSEPVMAADLMKHTRRCLHDKRIPVFEGERSSQDLLKAVPVAKHEELASCVENGIRKLYPQVTFFSFP